MNISLIIPTYNEHENIVELINKIKNNLDIKNFKFKIFIIDDSPKNIILNYLKNHTQNVDYIYRGKKLGRGSAVLEGIKYALKTKYTDIIIEMDADHSHDPAELNSKIEIFKKQKCDLLIASRYAKKSKIIGWPISRKILSFCSNILTKTLLKIPVSDYTNGYRFYSKSAAEHISRKCGNIGDGFIVLSEILLELHINNFKLDETDTNFRNRTKGLSSVNIRLIINSLIGLVKLYLIKKRNEKNS